MYMYSGIPHLTSEDAGGIPIPLNKMEVASPFPISSLYIFIYVYIYREREMHDEYDLYCFYDVWGLQSVQNEYDQYD